MFGRGTVVAGGAAAPEAWSTAERVVIDDSVVADPAATVALLHAAWLVRAPVVIDLRVDPSVIRQPVSQSVDAVWQLDAGHELGLDRLHHLVWANTYDARPESLTDAGAPRWWWAAKAARLGATETPEGTADITLPDGTPAWVDGGPLHDTRLDRALDTSPDTTLDTSPAAVVGAGGRIAGAVVIDAEGVAAGELRSLGLATPAMIAAAVAAADLALDQLAAVTHGAGPARIIAPAGSGKTRVLTERLRFLIGTRNTAPSRLLAVAYNVRAREEIQERTAGLAARAVTLNALGFRVLTVLGGGRRPQVLDEREARNIVDAELGQLGHRKQRRTNTDPIGPYLDAMTEVRLGLRDPRTVESRRPDVPGLTELVPRYRDRLRVNGVVDFDEQVVAAISGLLADGPMRRQVQASHQHLLVDELQDLTPAHVLLLRLLSTPRLDVFGVGDDDQVIYGHAGADPRFLVDYERYFPGAGLHPLEVNHRCPAAVVSAAAHLLQRNRVRVDKTIEAGAGAPGGDERLTIHRHAPEDGARSLVETVQAWLADGRRPDEIAVLGRVEALLLAPTVALADAGIPVRTSVGADVLRRTGVRAALAWLRMGLDQGHASSDDVVEVSRRPSRGFPRWAAKWLDRCSSSHELRRAADRIDDERVATRFGEMADDWEALADLADIGATTRQLLTHIRDVIGLGGAMAGLDASRGGEGSSHLDDLEALLQLADLHPDAAGFTGWLVDHLASVAARPGGETEPGDAVTVSTVHRVKGLEWPCVAVVGVTDGLLPHRLAEGPAAREEERRVFHVAITRGREWVAVLADATRPSPFLDEMAAPMTEAEQATESDAVRALGSDSPSGGGRRGARARVGGLPSPDELDGEQRARFVRLMEWRRDRVHRDGGPAYVIAHDRTLVELAVRNPSSLAELARCRGIGPAKLERFGEDILAVLHEDG